MIVFFFFFTSFCREIEQECQKILDILKVYGRCLSQHINKNKTTIFFSKSTPEVVKDHIKEALGVPKIKQYEKYLGLPSFVRRRKKGSLVEAARIGRKVIVSSRKESFNQGYSASYLHMYYELLQNSLGTL